MLILFRNLQRQILVNQWPFGKLPSELDTKDKKARINADAGEALYLNLAQAAIWKSDFDSAAKYIAKYKVLDPKGRNGVYKDIQDLYDDRKARYEANI
jgi:hypothetical protein